MFEGMFQKARGGPPPTPSVYREIYRDGKLVGRIGQSPGKRVRVISGDHKLAEVLRRPIFVRWMDSIRGIIIEDRAPADLETYSEITWVDDNLYAEGYRCGPIEVEEGPGAEKHFQGLFGAILKAQEVQEFEEQEHPRGQGGRFAEKPPAPEPDPNDAARAKAFPRRPLTNTAQEPSLKTLARPDGVEVVEHFDSDPLPIAESIPEHGELWSPYQAQVPLDPKMRAEAERSFRGVMSRDHASLRALWDASGVKIVRGAHQGVSYEVLCCGEHIPKDTPDQVEGHVRSYIDRSGPGVREMFQLFGGIQYYACDDTVWHKFTREHGANAMGLTFTSVGIAGSSVYGDRDRVKGVVHHELTHVLDSMATGGRRGYGNTSYLRDGKPGELSRRFGNLRRNDGMVPVSTYAGTDDAEALAEVVSKGYPEHEDDADEIRNTYLKASSEIARDFLQVRGTGLTDTVAHAGVMLSEFDKKIQGLEDANTIYKARSQAKSTAASVVWREADLAERQARQAKYQKTVDNARKKVERAKKKGESPDEIAKMEKRLAIYETNLRLETSEVGRLTLDVENAKKRAEKDLLEADKVEARVRASRAVKATPFAGLLKVRDPRAEAEAAARREATRDPSGKLHGQTGKKGDPDRPERPGVGTKINTERDGKHVSLFAEPHDSDDAFPPAVASYKIIEGREANPKGPPGEPQKFLMYTGRNGSMGVVTARSAKALQEWMQSVDTEIARRPPEHDYQKPWSPEDGGEKTVAAIQDRVSNLALRFGIDEPEIAFVTRVSDVGEGGSHGAGQMTVVNPQKTQSGDGYFEFAQPNPPPQQEIVATHEFFHDVFSKNPEQSRAAMDEFAQSGKHVTLYGSLSGPFEGFIEAAAAYAVAPDDLRRYHELTYQILERWEASLPKKR